MNNLTPFLAAANSGTTLTPLDWLAIAFYFGILLCVAWWVVRKNKDTATDYFLAGRNLSWWIIGASIFASNIGSEHIVGLAGSGAKDGVAMAHYELHAWCLLVLGWVFVPFYVRSLHRVADHVHRVEDRCRHFRGRCCIWNVAPGDATEYRRARD